MTLLSTQTKRRLRTYGRRILATPNGPLTHRCFFMHIPKCGGTSVSEALYATVPMSRRVGVIDANATRRAAAMWHADKNDYLLYHDDLPTGTHVFELREQMLLMHMAWQTDLIHGHVLFSQKAHRHFGDTYKYVTLLREPVARLVSNYNGSVSHGLTDCSFDHYLESSVARYHALTTLRYFSGQHDIAPDEEDATVQISLDIAKSFAVIGFLEDLDGFSAEFADVFGRRPRIFHYNQKRESAYRPTRDELRRAEALLRPELEFWEQVRKIG